MSDSNATIDELVRLNEKYEQAFREVVKQQANCQIISARIQSILILHKAQHINNPNAAVEVAAAAMEKYYTSKQKGSA